MTSSRRIGSPDAKNRTVLLDAAEQLMLEKGYAAVTSRRVAERAGLKPQLVHYYFRTMDDLFLEMFRRRAEEGLAVQAEVVKSPNPLRALWEFSTDPAAVAVTMEFIAMARHRDALRSEIARYSELFRVGQRDAARAALARSGYDLARIPPVVLSVLMTSISRVLVMEESLGLTAGHAETYELVEWCLSMLEGAADRDGTEPAFQRRDLA
ncbi:transcriptional regulator, TetR family [Rhodococcus rhodochrous J3]|uniref:TetR/AcrR family transcriptional regulator n=2 Tax=Rhodococcus rhodochrous TaxID=1829 RepID=A0AA47ACM3_RHORH|nr:MULTISPECIES: TetR/AcrR family transcriptional regulator [Rhodococcus]MDC3725968.1 TetR/AcrR family transcriptional regulator [Rhodococcus sp. Rp3]TWH44320.1 TetR family transcriptional regulator [Rhodococcus rhodochrous J38]UZF45548.1 TetR/AcrR family transcriptional regulator [Rhodococcus rhodochrous]WSE23155.1 helix-turn-helix domain-containing protein [Rhodococcus sp. PD04]SMG43727.1 transcriptional regulator, TetR family [Rhodococcus rhodochrous J3]